MNMTRKDLLCGLAIGAAVGLLGQPIIANNVQSPSLLVRVGFFVLMFLGAPAALAVASLIGRRFPSIYQFAKFAAVGVLNTTVDLGVFNVETFFWALPGTVLFATLKAVSFLVATTNSFFWNKYWTFSSTSAATAGEVTKFYSIAIAGFFVNVGVATFVRVNQSSIISPEHWVNIVAPLTGILATLFWNYFGYKLFVFKKAAGEAGLPAQPR